MIDKSGNSHPLDLFEFVVSLNLTGTFNLTRLVVAEIAKQEPVGPDGERGIVIMVSSSSAVRDTTISVVYPYIRSSKASRVK
jgi:3-hydroxyacyl-CoA dehydrogenase/3-hydroxy-2-methylbutyryl-CoA dehydrogenase